LKDKLSAHTLSEEHTKNLNAVKNMPEGSKMDMEGLKRACTITVLITTADMTDNALQQLDKSFPNDCLLIYRKNFAEYFGDAFSLHAALAVSQDLNWNFATRDTLRKHGLKDEEVNQFLENMPYRSYDDLVRKVPGLRTRTLDEGMGFLPYQCIPTAKRRRTQ
ncbi:hypothetical protein BGZ73_002182, partial [Actinomortierella ambigua]